MPADTGLGERLTAATPILVLGAGLLALFAGVEDWWVIFVLGWAVLTPLVAVLTGENEDATGTEWATTATAGGDERADDGGDSKEDALETLRDRYARGELTEAQFERKLERLLETETLEDARARVGGSVAANETERAGDRSRTREREREGAGTREP